MSDWRKDGSDLSSGGSDAALWHRCECSVFVSTTPWILPVMILDCDSTRRGVTPAALHNCQCYQFGGNFSGRMKFSQILLLALHCFGTKGWLTSIDFTIPSSSFGQVSLNNLEVEKERSAQPSQSTWNERHCKPGLRSTV
jgi:hypothetical protein